MSAETQAGAVAQKGLTPGERSQLHEDSVKGTGGGAGAAMTAIMQRELTSLFYSPIAYVVGFIFLLLTGYSFVTETLVAGNEATMRALFERMAGVLVFAIPLLTMRSIADEFATGAVETLMTAPVTETGVVLGKFFGTMLFYIILLATTLLHLVVMVAYARPVGSVVLLGYVGMILLGALFVAIGLFASACTRHQLLSATIATAILAVLTFVADYGAEYASTARLRGVCAYLNVFGHFSDFSKGVIDSGSVIFFVSGTAFFLFLATKVLESRRWR
jgi:ABC-2 type transport system permease protein